jgi:hypothetical protein
VALSNHDARYGNIFRVLSQIPALSKGQPSNSEPLIDWGLTSTAELVQLDRGCLHKKSDTRVLIRITTPLKGRHPNSGTQYHIDIY